MRGTIGSFRNRSNCSKFVAGGRTLIDTYFNPTMPDKATTYIYTYTYTYTCLSETHQNITRRIICRYIIIIIVVSTAVVLAVIDLVIVVLVD